MGQRITSFRRPPAQADNSMSGPVPIHLGLEAHAAVPQPAALTHAVRVVAGAADIKSPDTSRCITFTCSFTMLMIIILGTAVLFFTILTIIMITRVSVFIAGASYDCYYVYKP